MLTNVDFVIKFHNIKCLQLLREEVGFEKNN